jgi:hypothetical protein
MLGYTFIALHCTALMNVTSLYVCRDRSGKVEWAIETGNYRFYPIYGCACGLDDNVFCIESNLVQCSVL